MYQIVLLRSPEFLCEGCNIQCSKRSDWNRHIKTTKHVKQHTPVESFDCSNCNYSTNIKKDWEKHLNTKKHNERDEKTHGCTTCDRIFNNYKTCWAHKQKCLSKTADVDYKNIIGRLITENQELRTFFVTEIRNIISEQSTDTQKILTELMKNNTVTNINNNQKFNINVFLTEQCKDAINFSDFIKSIEVSREDLENNAQLGFVNGVSKILIDHLNRMSVNERPIHCTDVKRETMYIKDEDKWTREEDPTKVNKAIQEVTRKSMGTLMDWKDENPDYKDRDSAFSERCIVIQQQSMAAHNRDTYFPKVARAIAKEVVVDK